MKIIGLGHYSRVGKDTFADYLRDALWAGQPGIRVAKISLAYKLKQITHDLYAWAGMREPEFYETPEGAAYRDIPLEKLGDKTPVQVWVDFGTKAVRNNVWERTWLDYLLNTDHGVDVLIVPDVRFPNEFDVFLDAGAKLFKVVRPGFGPRKTVADRALLHETRWHRIIGGGTVEDLAIAARAVAYSITADVWHIPQTSHERNQLLACEVIEPWEPEAA